MTAMQDIEHAVGEYERPRPLPIRTLPPRAPSLRRNEAGMSAMRATQATAVDVAFSHST